MTFIIKPDAINCVNQESNRSHFIEQCNVHYKGQIWLKKWNSSHYIYLSNYGYFISSTTNTRLPDFHRQNAKQQIFHSLRITDPHYTEYQVFLIKKIFF